jgi:capsular exopolysaccharide synthesis family protein
VESRELAVETRPAPVAIPLFGRAPVAPQPGPVQESDAAGGSLDLRELLGTMRRHWLLVAGVALAVAAALARPALTEPDSYRSEATVRLGDVRATLTDGIGDPSIDRLGMGRRDPLLSQMEVLRSRSLLGRVVDAQGLRLNVDGAGDDGQRLLVPGPVPGDAPSDTFSLRFDATGFTARHGRQAVRAPYGQQVTLEGSRFGFEANPGVNEARLLVTRREDAVTRLQGALKARPRNETDLFDVSYEAAGPRRAQRILAAAVDEFQSHNARQAQQQSRRRRVFLEGQLAETDAVLAQAREALTAFRRDRRIFSSRDEFSSQQQGVDAIQLRRDEMEAERQISRSLLAAVERGGGGGALRALVAAPAVASNGVVVDLYGQLVRYETQRDSLTTGPFRAAPGSPEVQRLDQLITGTQGRIADAVRSQLASLDARIASLDGTLGRRETRIQSLPDVEAEEMRLVQQVSTTQGVADALLTELQKARIAEAVEVGQVEVVDPAILPAGPIPQHRGARVVFGLLLGLAVGGAAALLRERLNTTITGREQLESLLGVSTLAVIPQINTDTDRPRRRLPGRRRGGGELQPGRLAALEGSSGAESYRTLRTNLLFSGTRRLRTLVLTSSNPAEGKTTTSSNLAATFAQQGKRVALLDCDLRRPRQHEVFGLPREPGLTQLLLGYAAAAEVQSPTGVENLFLIATGTLPPNPSELLGSDRMEEVLDDLRASFDIVIIDTPPVLVAPDASVLAARVDGVILVVRAGVTERDAAAAAVQQLRTVDANLVGAVLNDPDAKLPSYSGYYSRGYSYKGYGAAQPAGTR